MIPISFLPTLNFVLNSTSGVLLLAGFLLIRSGHVRAHRACMIAAFATSTAFLTSYLIYHYNVGDVKFQGTGWIRPTYFSMLASHVILAIVIVPLALVTLRRALKGRFIDHRRIARWTFPLWMYVSVTGVLVYLLVYQLYPAPRLPAPMPIARASAQR